MGQYEVYQWLKSQREMGNDQYFTTKEVEQGLKNNGCENGNINKTIRGDLVRLTVSGYLEVIDLDKTGFNNYHKVFRYKKDG